MPLDEKLQQKILIQCQQEQYNKAADLVAGETKETASYDRLVAALKKIGTSATPGVVTSVYNIYTDESGNIPELEKGLDDIVSIHTTNSITMVAPKGDNGEEKEEVSEGNLSQSIQSTRKKQQDIMDKTGKPDEALAAELTDLIKRQEELSGGQGERFQKKDIVLDGAPSPGAKNWFVLPESTELEKYESVKVVLGSPMVEVLRDRYENQYKAHLKDTDELLGKQAQLSAEGQFELKKELDRERAFTNSYKDTDMVEDQDIYVHQVASKFITDQYDVVESQLDKQDKSMKYYDFGNGKLIDRYDTETKTHRLSVEGEIPGAFTVCIKRRTNSGRIIDDAYDIVEYRDGVAKLYAKSSKGNISIKYVDEIKRSAEQADTSLQVPVASGISEKEAGVSEIKDIPKDLSPPKIPDSPPAEQNIVNQPTSPVETPLPQHLEQELVSAPQADPVLEKPQELPPLPAAPVVLPEQGLPDQSQAVQSSEPVLDAGYYRAQLLAAKTKDTSLMTMNYLADQLAKAEGKPLDDVKKEFGLVVAPAPLAVPQEERSVPSASPTPIAEVSVPAAMEAHLQDEKPPSALAPIVAKLQQQGVPLTVQNSKELGEIKRELSKGFDPNAKSTAPRPVVTQEEKGIARQ